MYAIAFGLGHIKMIRVDMLREKDGVTLLYGTCFIVCDSSLLIPLPSVVGVSWLYWGAVSAGAPDWLVPTTNG